MVQLENIRSHHELRRWYMNSVWITRWHLLDKLLKAVGEEPAISNRALLAALLSCTEHGKFNHWLERQGHKWDWYAEVTL